jgi:thiamine transport system permease protein
VDQRVDRHGGPLTSRRDSGVLGGRTALLLAVPPLVFLVVFFVWPVVSILTLGLAPGGSVDVAAALQAIGQRTVLEDIVFTVVLATSATALTLVFGLPVAWVFARFSFPGRDVARALATVPFVLPTVVVATAFLALLGPRNPIVGTIWAVLLASIFYNLAVILRLVGGLWSHLDPRLEEAARVLGASPFGAFREVTWPLLRPAMLSAVSIVFLFNVTSFGVVLLLGGPGPTTLEVEIYRQTAQLLDLRTAAALAIVQLCGVVALLVAYARSQERLAVTQRLRPASETARPARTGRERVAVTVILGALALYLGLPLAVLVVRSVTALGGPGLQAYADLWSAQQSSALFVPPSQAIANSIVFATATMLLATGLGLMASLVIGYRRGWLSSLFDTAVMLPLGTSAVVLGFGFIITLDAPPLDLRTSALLIPIAHTLIAMPFVLRALVPVIRSIDPRQREAAAILGASGSRTWREVDLPVIRRQMLVGSAFAFAVSLGEFGATIFIARPDTPTIPIAVARLLSVPGAVPFAMAMAMSTLLMLLTAAALLIVERFRMPGAQPF